MARRAARLFFAARLTDWKRSRWRRREWHGRSRSIGWNGHFRLGNRRCGHGGGCRRLLSRKLGRAAQVVNQPAAADDRDEGEEDEQNAEAGFHGGFLKGESGASQRELQISTRCVRQMRRQSHLGKAGRHGWRQGPAPGGRREMFRRGPDFPRARSSRSSKRCGRRA